MTRPVFVTGATGVLGPALVRRLVNDRVPVRALVRRPDAPLPPGVGRVMGDLDAFDGSTPDAISRALEGAGAVVHLAAKLHVNAPAAELEGLYRRVNVVATERLVSMAAAAGVETFAFASTINVFGGEAPGRPWTETDEPRPDTLYAQTKYEAEQAVLAEPGGRVLRLAAIYGPGMKGNYPMLARLLRAGLRVLPGDGTNLRTLVHVEDAAQAFALAAAGAVPPGTYHVTDGQTHSLDAILRSMQEWQGKKPGIRYVPPGVVRAALVAPAAVASLLGRSLPGPALVDKLTEEVAVSGDRLINGTPYHPKMTDLTAGWSATALD